MEILSELNDRQKEAALCTEGPLLILAGAGSGKTKTIITRIAYILKQRLAWPSEILAITFTNKAAAEMRERIAAMAIPGTEYLWMSTFHAMCARILRRDAEKLGYTKNFTIYDTDDQKRLVKALLKERQIDEKQLAPNTVLHVISDVKNRGLTPERYRAEADGFHDTRMAGLYEAYQQKLKACDAMDFDDLLLNTNILFKNYPDVLRYYQDKFKYILVDEYQDTNHSQYELVTALAGASRNLCVCGDDDQSIYGWRGADISNILDFEKDWPDATVVKLEENYRSTPVILSCANAVIHNNRGRKEKNLWTQNDNGKFDKVSLSSFEQGYDEARWVARQISALQAENGYSYDDFAVLYRTNAQSRLFEEALSRAGIPSRTVGAISFYARAEIRDMMAYLSVLNNPKDDISFLRIINTPKRKIGAATIEKLQQFAAFKHWSLYETVLNAEAVPTLTAGPKEKVRALAGLFKELAAAAAQDPVDVLLEKIYTDSGYEAMLRTEKVDQAESRRENIEELISAAKDFTQTSDDTSATAFLETVALTASTDDMEGDAGQVTLMTLHSAKGLEFPVVFMPGMEDGIFPGWTSREDPEKLEEERRLCYVGITRAREKLYLSHADRRTIYGREQIQMPSEFLDELPEECIEKDARVVRAAKITAKRPDRTIHKPGAGLFASGGLSKTSGAAYKQGDKVAHKKFGIGTVVSAGSTLTVAFPGIGIKKLDPGFVKPA